MEYHDANLVVIVQKVHKFARRQLRPRHLRQKAHTARTVYYYRVKLGVAVDVSEIDGKHFIEHFELVVFTILHVDVSEGKKAFAEQRYADIKAFEEFFVVARSP